MHAATTFGGQPPKPSLKGLRKRRLCGAAFGFLRSRLIEAPERDAKLFGLVCEIGGDAGAGEHDDADRQCFEHPIVTLEGRRVAVAVPVGLLDHLCDFALIGPAGGDAFGAARTAAMQQDHCGMLGADLVEGLPDAEVIVAVSAAGESDAGAGRRQHFGVGPSARRDKFPAVDDGSGERPVIDKRSGMWTPAGSGRDLVEFGGVVAREFKRVAPLDQAEALTDQALKLDRLDLGAVLLGLAAALRLFVAVEFALDAVDLAVKQVHERPQEIGEIVLQAGAGEHGAEGFDRGVELALHDVGLGQGSRTGSSWPGR